jgi:assimilatory nitrate reductase catalytic subunit
MTHTSVSKLQVTDTQIKTTCPYCGVGCGITVDKQIRVSADLTNEGTVSETVSQEQLSTLIGDINHPANSGKLCVKGTHLLETNGPQGRLEYPHINGERVSWNKALDEVATSMRAAIDEHGPDSIAFYLSGQLLTEDYYVANKLLKGFVGSANVDTNSRLCMSSAVAAYKRAFGADTVPCCYEDLSHSDLIVFVGSNAAWTHPVLYQQIKDAKKQNTKMQTVCIDPRNTATAGESDIHLPIRPGSDAYLFNGLLHFLANNDALNHRYIDVHTQGFAEALQNTSNADVASVAKQCDVSEALLKRFYALFANAESAISFYSMGINQSSSGVDKANSIINCHLATGKIGKLGSGPFSITGQPNAMGGREVGGLANMLAAHMDIENPEHRNIVKEFWQAPNMVTQAGYKAVDMFEQITNGTIKFIWIMGTNPVVSMPNRNAIEKALAVCPTVVISEVVNNNDTLPFANITLPACGWSEKDGTVTNSERTISRQRALISPHKAAMPDWKIISEVAKRLGFAEAFAYEDAAEIFCEHAALTGFKNQGRRDLDLSALASLTKAQYDAMAPIQWPVTEQSPMGTKRMFTDAKFFTASGRANFIPIIPRQALQITSEQYPLVLNTGRMRDQWHTMTRTGKAAKLHQHTQQAYVYMNPFDAAANKVGDDDLVALASSVNPATLARPIILPVKIDNKQRPGELFCPIHWSKTASSHVNLAALFTNAVDPISGQPELKHAAVSVSPLTPNMQGTLFSKDQISPQLLNEVCDYYVEMMLENAWVYRLAIFQQSVWAIEKGIENIHQWQATLSNKLLLQHEIYTGDNHAQKPPYSQQSSFTLSCLALKQAKVDYFWQLATALPTSQDDWLNHLFKQDCIDNSDLHKLMHGEVDSSFAQGKRICSCYQVHESPIIEAIKEGIDSVQRLGERLKCGTKCGSCKSELSQLITQHRTQTFNSESIEITVEM